MKNFNNLYNFKNPIRHFFNLDALTFNEIKKLSYEDLCWTIPVKFKVFKTDATRRTISFPNILNYYHAIKNFESERNFYSIQNISSRKRVAPNLDIGEFSAFSYYDCIKRDVFNLTKYDNLLVLDIKSFYGRIYTHDLGYDGSNSKKLERRVGSLNNGRTNGLLMGSYLSLYLAEVILEKIEANLDEELKNQGVDCHYEYFSDDFYFFCNNSDVEKIKEIFSNVLNSYELEINYEKISIYDFEEYTQNNNLDKLWRTIISQAERVDSCAKHHPKKTHPSFFTQLVYRLNQIKELKYKRIFLSNFFKTHYFSNFEPNIYVLSESDFNHICYIYKLMPETILYSLHKLKSMQGFDMIKFKDFLRTRFKSSLHTEKQEEQVYFYYALKVCKFEDDLKDFKELVLNSCNQILISYYIIDKTIGQEEYREQFSPWQESQWLQNYHYCLIYEPDKIDCLLPLNITKERQKKSYSEFYKQNIDAKTPIIKPIDEISDAIDMFVEDKIATYIEERDNRGI